MVITAKRREERELHRLLSEWCDEMMAVTPIEEWGEELATLLETWADEYDIVLADDSYDELQEWMYSEQLLALAEVDELDEVEEEPPPNHPIARIVKADASEAEKTSSPSAHGTAQLDAEKEKRKLDEVVDFVLEPGPEGFLDQAEKLVSGRPLIPTLAGIAERMVAAEAFEFYRKMFAVVRDIKDQPDGGLVTGAVIGYGAALGDKVGVRDVDDAIQGEDLFTGEKLSTGQRVTRGIFGGLSIITTALGFAGRIVSGGKQALATARQNVSRVRSLGQRLKQLLSILRTKKVRNRGAWALDDLTRGEVLEWPLGKNTAKGFPYIDRWEPASGTAISIKTTRIDRDLKRVENQLRGWVRDTASFPPKVEKKGFIKHLSETIELSNIKKRGLRVGIEPGVSTPAHKELFDRIRDYARSHRLDFVEFVEIK